MSESTRKLFRERRVKYVRHYGAREWSVLFKTTDERKLRDYCAANDLGLTVHPDGSVTTVHLKPAMAKPRFSDRTAFVNSIPIQVWQEEELGRTTTICRLEDDSRIPRAVMREIDEVAESLTVDLPWQAGDFAMVDNTRMMHGRRPFSDPERTVYARMCRSLDW